ncbi:MAG TPA: UDP-galactopyranose mutase [Polyangia bacterium]|jgi:UDP-galactopyranose mutase
MIYDYIVVGAGLFGSVFAREVKDAGKSVLVLEKRGHIGGNCYTYEFEDSGITVPGYGPHIFHTNSVEIWNYLHRFTEFNRYQHRPLTTHENRVYTLPINLGTINAFYGVNLKPSEVTAFLRERTPVNPHPRNFEEKAISLVGPELYQAFFKGYSTKQWHADLTKLPADLITRLPVRNSYYDSYYDDLYQGMPLRGYTAIFEELLKDVPVELDTDFAGDKERWLGRCRTLVYTGPVDEYFDCCHGRLRWGSVRFETESLAMPDYQGTSVMNFADLDVPYTRIVEPKHFHRERKFNEKQTVIIREYSYFDPLKPFYPVRMSDDLELLARYQTLAAREPKVLFGGRLAEYKYYDMDDVIAEALRAVRRVMQ